MSGLNNNGVRRMNIVEKISKDQIDRVVENRPIPEFGPGDTLKVHVKVVVGTRERVQIFEGVCIARKADSINSNIWVFSGDSAILAFISSNDFDTLVPCTKMCR